MRRAREWAAGPPVLLYFREFERDRFVRHDRYVRRVVRPVYKALTRRQRVTGFAVWCRLLIQAMRVTGREVRLNDRRAARADPSHPVGLVGYPQLLDVWDLPNPAVLGPALYDHPKQAPLLMDDPRFRYYLVTCPWMRALFEPYYGDSCVDWHAGIDLAEWSDASGARKDIDVLLYDKVRWNRDTFVPQLIEPILTALAGRGLRVEQVRYGHYQHGDYRRALHRARSMIFLCEHETQGMAYQEALASNVPVLAWDNGWWLDPRRAEFSADPVQASSVPYFDDRCGLRFSTLDQFPQAFDQFWSALETFRPRDYVRTHLSFESSAAQYLRYYDALFDR